MPDRLHNYNLTRLKNLREIQFLYLLGLLVIGMSAMNDAAPVSHTPVHSMPANSNSLQEQGATLKYSNFPEVVYINNPADSYTVPTGQGDEGTEKITVLPDCGLPTRARTLCGLKRNVFLIVLSTFAVGVIIGGVIGAVALKGNEPPETPHREPADDVVSPYVDDRPILPGTFLAATTNSNDNRLFYQDLQREIHHVYCPNMDCAAYGSTNVLIPDVSDAKLYSPLAAVDNNTEVYLYYFNEANNLREKIWHRNNDAWSDGPLNELSVSAYERSSLAVVLLDYSKQIRVYYQQSDGHIYEVSFSVGNEWKNEGNITEAVAAPATKIAAIPWDSGTMNSSLVQVYYQTTRLRLNERCLSPEYSWFDGAEFLKSDVLGLPVDASLGAIGKPSLSVFATFQSEQIYDYKRYKGGSWPWGKAKIIADVLNYTYPIAVTHWPSQRRVWVYYQGNNSSLNVVDSLDGGDAWQEAKVVVDTVT